MKKYECYKLGPCLVAAKFGKQVVIGVDDLFKAICLPKWARSKSLPIGGIG